jgi:hypothetical protein
LRETYRWPQARQPAGLGERRGDEVEVIKVGEVEHLEVDALHPGGAPAVKGLSSLVGGTGATPLHPRLAL